MALISDLIEDITEKEEIMFNTILYSFATSKDDEHAANIFSVLLDNYIRLLEKRNIKNRNEKNDLIKIQIMIFLCFIILKITTSGYFFKTTTSPTFLYSSNFSVLLKNKILGVLSLKIEAYTFTNPKL